MEIKDVLNKPKKAHKVQAGKIAIEKGEQWGEVTYGSKRRYYDLYLGPVDEDDCVSDDVFLSDEWLSSVFNQADITSFEMNASENHHLMYIDNDEDAEKKFNSLLNIIQEQGFDLVRNCY